MVWSTLIHPYSHFLFLYLPYGSAWENLFKDQEIILGGQVLNSHDLSD